MNKQATSKEGHTKLSLKDSTIDSTSQSDDDLCLISKNSNSSDCTSGSRSKKFKKSQKNSPVCSLKKAVKRNFSSSDESYLSKRSKVNNSSAMGTEDATIPIIYHSPKYICPYYLDPSLKELPKKQQIENIMAYHNTLHSKLKDMKLSALKGMRWSTPIHSSPTFNGSLEKYPKGSINYDAGTSSPQQGDIYISRSGRQVKKVLSTVDIELERESPSPEKNNCIKKTPQQSKKLTNKEIKSRSSIFRDSPTSHKTRTKEIIKNAAEESRKKDLADEEMEIFEKSLRIREDSPPVQVIASYGGGNVSKSADSSSYQKMRVQPPQFGGKKQSQVLIPINDMPSTSSATVKNEADSPHSKMTGNKRGKRKTVDCPICNFTFPVREIEEHASTCGVTAALEIESNFPTQGNMVMKICAICDQEFPFNTNFEVHVMECKRKNREPSNM